MSIIISADKKNWGFRVERDCTIRKIEDEGNVIVTFVAFKHENTHKGTKTKAERIKALQYDINDKNWMKDVVLWVRSAKLPE